MPNSGYLTSRPLRVWNQYSGCARARRVDSGWASAHDAVAMSKPNPFVLSLPVLSEAEGSKDASNISEH